jgi:hypothetical protein
VNVISECDIKIIGIVRKEVEANANPTSTRRSYNLETSGDNLETNHEGEKPRLLSPSIFVSPSIFSHPFLCANAINRRPTTNCFSQSVSSHSLLVVIGGSCRCRCLLAVAVAFLPLPLSRRVKAERYIWGKYGKYVENMGGLVTDFLG